MLGLLQKNAWVGGRATKISRWLGRGLWAVLDQGLFAGSNFAMNVLLARWLPQEQYGAYVFAYSAFLLLGAFHTAILTEPMLVFGAGRHARHFRRYLALLLYGHLGVGGAICLIITAAAIILWWSGSPVLVEALAGLAVASPFILLLWLLRRAFYVRSQPQWAATGGALYLGAMLVGAYGLYRWSALSPASALACIGASAFAVSLWLVARLQPRWRPTQGDLDPGVVLADHWTYGRWSGATTIFLWIPTNVYYVAMPVWMGLAGSGALRAVMNLILPILQANSALSILLVAEFARILKTGGQAKLRRTVRWLLVAFSASFALYWSFLLLFGREALLWLYAGQYGEYAGLLVLAGLLPLSNGIAAVLGAALRANERPDNILWCCVASSLTALSLGLWLLATLGVRGAVIGLLASSIVTASAMSWFYLDRPEQRSAEG